MSIKDEDIALEIDASSTKLGNGDQSALLIKAFEEDVKREGDGLKSKFLNFFKKVFAE